MSSINIFESVLSKHATDPERWPYDRHWLRRDERVSGRLESTIELNPFEIEEFQEATVRWYDESTPEEQNALAWFKKGGDAAMNALSTLDYFNEPINVSPETKFVAPKVRPNSYFTSSIEGVRKANVALNQMLARAPRTPIPLVLFRGIKSDWKTAQEIASTKDPFVSTSFQSFSRSPDVADGFADPLFLAVVIPAGTRLADTSFLQGEALWHIEELEIIFPPGTWFWVQFSAPRSNNYLVHFRKFSEDAEDIVESEWVTNATPLIVMDYVPRPDIPFVARSYPGSKRTRARRHEVFIRRASYPHPTPKRKTIPIRNKTQ
jgi:hypothetical protein